MEVVTHNCTLTASCRKDCTEKNDQSGLLSSNLLNALFLFPWLFFYVSIESPDPRNPEGPKPYQMKTPTTQYKTPTPNQTEVFILHDFFCTHPIKLLSCRQHNQYLWWHLIGHIQSSVERQHLDSAQFSFHSFLGFKVGWVQISGLKSYLASKPKFETENLTKIYVTKTNPLSSLCMSKVWNISFQVFVILLISGANYVQIHDSFIIQRSRIITLMMTQHKTCTHKSSLEEGHSVWQMGKNKAHL